MRKVAHINGKCQQSVQEHLENVGKLAAEFCKDYQIQKLDVSQYAYETGLAHDIGKYSEAFQRKIKENLDISVDHSTAGAREMQKKRMLAAAFAIAGHHGGIPNGRDTTKQNLMERITKRELEPYEEYKEEVSLKVVEEPKLSSFDEAFFTRMVFSALVDADFLDTERFMNRGNVERGNYDSINNLYKKVMGYIEPWRNVTEQTSKLNGIRTDILEQCLRQGEEERGLYSLTVPTGGGKTVSSLAFALTHAKKHEMQRIIYVIPYTSIIEQNVAVFRKILGEQNVLAHYSNSFLDSENVKKDYYEKHKLSIENWDAPVIVTTNVQFFESLYSNRVSKCRKLHNIANSVVIFDEVQMIPLNYLKPCVKAIQSLVESYQVSAVLCSATQPALEKWMKPLMAKEICPNYRELFQCLKRTQIKDAGKITEGDLLQRIISENQILIIVNTKKEAQNIYQKMQDEGSYHLSTYMTPYDRKRTLRIIRERLQKGEKCRVISTSLVEAGVDLDFPVVFREMAGLDSIIQAAGRCNREGKRSLDESMVWVFRLEEKIPAMIEKNVAMTEETLQKYEQYDAPDVIRYYFTSLQSLDEGTLDQYHIIDGFERNLDGIVMPFKKVAEVFHLIDSDTRMLVIPVEEEAIRLVEELQERIRNQENFKVILQKLGIYAINIYSNEYQKMLEDNSAYEIIDGIGALQRLSIYSKEMGLCYEKSDGATVV